MFQFFLSEHWIASFSDAHFSYKHFPFAVSFCVFRVKDFPPVMSSLFPIRPLFSSGFILLATVPLYESILVPFDDTVAPDKNSRLSGKSPTLGIGMTWEICLARSSTNPFPFHQMVFNARHSAALRWRQFQASKAGASRLLLFCQNVDILTLVQNIHLVRDH